MEWNLSTNLVAQTAKQIFNQSPVGQGFSLANKSNKKPYKKRIRLRTFDYKGCYRYSITICTFNKRSILHNKSLISWLIDVLKQKAEIFRFKVWAYCFMPDHLHLLIEGKMDSSDMVKFITSFKQSTGYHYKRKTGNKLWQVNFYEHILRKEEETKAVANYIFCNPLRKGLVDDYKNYPFLGSFEYDIMQT